MIVLLHLLFQNHSTTTKPPSLDPQLFPQLLRLLGQGAEDLVHVVLVDEHLVLG